MGVVSPFKKGAARGRFQSAKQGMNTRKHSWVCMYCNAHWITKKKVCQACGSREIQYFPSRAELRRYWQLRLLLKFGKISQLVLQPSYPCVVEGKLITTYRADFKYINEQGATVVEDVKGFATDLFKLKKALVEALYPVVISVLGTK